MIALDSLRNVDIFQGLSDEELGIVCRFCLEENVPVGVTLCAEGTRADKLFILQQGAVSIQFKKGANYSIQTPGKILGWSFLIPPNRYTASVVTIAPSLSLIHI